MNNPKENREKSIKLFFEKFNVPKYYTCYDGVLAMYASGRTTGIDIDMGDGGVRIYPVHICFIYYILF